MERNFSSRVAQGTLLVFTALVLCYLLLPIVVIVTSSFTSSRYLEFPPPGFSLRWYQQMLSEPKWISVGLRSVIVALATTAISLMLGTLGALALTWARIPGAALLRSFIISPLIVPKIMTAIAIFFVYAPLKLVGTNAALITSHVVLALPFVFVIMSAAVAGYDRTQTWAALCMGASHGQAALRVMLPQLLPALGSSALFAFLASFDDVIMAIFLAGITANTLPKEMFDSAREEVTPVLAAVATVMVGATILLWGVIAVLQKRQNIGQ